MNNNDRVAIGEDAEFMKLDEELYKAIQNVVTKSGLKEFEINAGSHIFNTYCELRNAISEIIDDEKAHAIIKQKEMGRD